jgi:FMN-dependent NADH-azoreductase
MKVLHIEASPDQDRSRTRAVAQHFLGALQRLRPDAQLRSVDVWSADLPPFDDRMIAAKFAVLRRHDASDEQRAAWRRATALADDFNAADLYLISTPMWNFSLPYRLKHYIDVVTLPGSNWSWSVAEGYRGLLHGKRAVLVTSSAGDYPASGEDAADFQKRYLRHWLRFVGITEVETVNIAPTLAQADRVAETLQQARQEVERVAAIEAAVHRR